MAKANNGPEISEEDARSLADLAGAHDPETVYSLFEWLVRETPDLRRIPDLVDQLKGDEEAAREELRPLSKVAREFAEIIRNAPHALERIRMLYAEELSNVLPIQLGREYQRRLDQDLQGMGRFMAALEAANSHICSEEEKGPALFGPRKAAEKLVSKYEEISYQKFHFYIPENINTGDIWQHPHTSHGARFVAAALKVMFPNLNDTNLKRILEERPQYITGNKKYI